MSTPPSILSSNAGPTLRRANPDSPRDGAALAAHNARRVLQDRYPTVPYEVRVCRSRRTVALRVSWLLDPPSATPSPTAEHVGIALRRFVKEGPVNDPSLAELQRMTGLFQALFGQVDTLDVRPYTLDQVIAHEQDALRRVMDAEQDPDVDPVHRSRSRL